MCKFYKKLYERGVQTITPTETTINFMKMVFGPSMRNTFILGSERDRLNNAIIQTIGNSNASLRVKIFSFFLQPVNQRYAFNTNEVLPSIKRIEYTDLLKQLYNKQIPLYQAFKTSAYGWHSLNHRPGYALNRAASFFFNPYIAFGLIGSFALYKYLSAPPRIITVAANKFPEERPPLE